MKPRSGRLQTLVRLVRLGERGAREGLARANAELGRREQQQHLLESWEHEYAARWLERGRAGIDSVELARLAAFRASLDDTLALQRGVLEAAREQHASSAARWAGQRRRLQMFEELAARAHTDEARSAARRQTLAEPRPLRRDTGQP